jgi:hypothetical protein
LPTAWRVPVKPAKDTMNSVKSFLQRDQFCHRGQLAFEASTARRTSDLPEDHEGRQWVQAPA